METVSNTTGIWSDLSFASSQTFGSGGRQLQTNGFHNEDVAGIAYSAQLLHQGGLPLIDTLELKARAPFS